MSQHIITVPTTQEFVDTAVKWITGCILEEQEDSEKQVMIGLAGGKTPTAIYTKLSTESVISWERVLCFLIDERYVPASSPDSNQKVVWETFLTHNASRARALFPNTSLPLADCIDSYNEQLRDLKPDIVIIGMGDDGHIASLFPPLGDNVYGPDRVIHTTTDTFAVHDRITVTLPVLLSASHRLFLITGEQKAALLQKMQSVSEDISLYPAQYLFDERTTWLVGP